MERKSIGAFIAALRKANGMTQKNLAEKLNVSDKSVSRWERDEGAPDLSLFPVMAELFGVTCDELLRGERKPMTEPMEAASPENSPRTQKQRQRVLTAGLSKYKNRSFIAVGVATAGLLTAMIGNFGFNRAYIGFLLGTMLYLAAAICQAIFVNGAFLSIADEALGGPEVERFKRSVISWAQKIFSFIVILLAISLPLILYPSDTYMGLTAESWFLLGVLPFGLLALLFCALIHYFSTNSFIKRGLYNLPDKEAAVYQHNFKLKRRCALALLVILLLTLVGHVLATGAGNTLSVVQGTSFPDYHSFQVYMEQDIPAAYYGDDAPVQVAPDHAVVYYDEQGNQITEAQALRRTIKDSKGRVVCEYLERNHSVVSIRYGGNPDGSVLPITVFTQADAYEAQRKILLYHATFAAVYALEAAGMFAFYVRRRKK